MIAAPLASSPTGDVPCPICTRVIKKPHKAKKLYGFRVCHKCRNGFANRRQLAYIVDAFLFYVVLFVFGAATALVVPALMAEFTPHPLLHVLSLESVFGIIAGWGMPLVFFCKDGFRGRSPGKALCGVQVVDRITRQPIGFAASFKRNLILLVPIMPLIVAFMLLGGRRLGDRWAGTEVIWRKHQFRPPFDPRGNRCIGCGYDLTGNVSGRCPECFTPVRRPPVAIPVGTQPSTEPADAEAEPIA